MLHDTQAAPGTRAIRDTRLGLAEDHDDNVGAGHPDAILVTASSPSSARFSSAAQRLETGGAIGIGAAALTVVKRAKRSLSVSALSNGAARRIGNGKAAPPPVNRVRRKNPYSTADRHGQSRAENIRLDESLRFLRRWPCLFLSTGCDGTSEPEQRARIRSLKQTLAVNQRRAGLPRPYYVEVIEGSPELHAHIVAAFPRQADAIGFGHRLEESPTYGAWICGEGQDAWRLVSDWHGLRNYLSKEATPQAWHGAGRNFYRLRTAERLGSVSGDRVRLSDALEHELVALDRIEARTRTYAARAPVPAVAKPVVWFCEALKNLTGETNRRRAAERPMGTAEFPDTLKAGFCETTPEACDHYAPAREASSVAQLPLPMVAPVIDLAALAEAKRKDLGLSQREAARLLGIRQPHWSNSINRRHDRFSAWRQNRLREFTADRVAA